MDVLSECKEHFGDNNAKWAELRQFVQELTGEVPKNSDFAAFKVHRGVYNLGGPCTLLNTPAKTAEPKKPTVEAPAKTEDTTDLGVISGAKLSKASFVPRKKSAYVPFGFAPQLKKVLQTGHFLPIMVTGETGEGKTLIVDQEAARLGREVFRVNCTPETDEADLIGDLRLIDGNTVFQKGPALEAMERGAILMLDEVDALRPDKGCFCLYSILEGSGAFVKATSSRVEHADGFTVVCTSNTKGRGTANGEYIGTNNLNLAFLDRMDIMFEHTAPKPAVRKRIMKGNANEVTADVSSFIDNLVTWATVIQKTVEVNGAGDKISTRRLVKIIKLYDVFGDRLEVIRMAISRFDSEVVESYVELYTKIDANPDEYKQKAGIQSDPDPVPSSIPKPNSGATAGKAPF